MIGNTFNMVQNPNDTPRTVKIHLPAPFPLCPVSPQNTGYHLYWCLVCPYRIWTNINSSIPSTHIHFLHKRRHATVMTAPRFSSVYPETCPRRTHTNSLFLSTSATLPKEGSSFTELVFHSQTFEVLQIFYFTTVQMLP